MTDNINKYYVPDDRDDKEKFFAIWEPSCGAEATARAWDAKQEKQRIQTHMVMGDIQPYQSMIDGSMITSRSQHKRHLKQHNCIEVGNETKYLKPAKVAPPPGLKQELIDQVNAQLRY